MSKQDQTQVGALHVRQRPILSPADPKIEWIDPPRKKRSESLLSNLAVASALVLCVVTLRSGAIPGASKASDALLAAATSDQSLEEDDLLDDQLGRLSFVSALFPEAALVFGSSTDDALTMPVSGGVVVHAWSEQEPYMSWRTSQTEVTSSSAGEVVGIYHGNGEERLVQVMGHDGLSCVYGNLGTVAVSVGDAVAAGEVLGDLMSGADCVFEVRRDGRSIDPALYMRSR